MNIKNTISSACAIAITFLLSLFPLATSAATAAISERELPSTDAFVTGFRFGDFVVTRARPIPELQYRLIELIHEPSQARVIHVQADDRENLFSLSFQTVPSSSNGVAHVLEHTVLHGSEKFPVRAPLFSMMRRSMKTLMNAFTASDVTCYPASSQIKHDFYNLLDIYTDAVFHPLLRPLSFMQEGLRFELVDKEKLNINGVVYNEMKGVMSDPYQRLLYELCGRLFPTSPYGLNSGGDPEQIPTLTLDELKNFHATYYHPSRCIFFFYGDLPLAEHLAFIEKRALSAVSPLPPLPPIQKQTPFSAPVYDSISFPVASSGSVDKNSHLAFGWLTTHISNQLECLALNILNTVLLETDASPLRHRLLQSGLCKQIMGFSDTEIVDVPYVILVSGCNSEDSNALEQLLFSTFEKLAQEGIPKEQIESALHQIELSTSEITTRRAPFNISFLALHGIDPINGLLRRSLFQRLRDAQEKDPLFFQKLIKKYFVDNRHFVRLTMAPTHTFEMETKKKEEERLSELLSNLSEEQKKDISTQAENLIAFQHEEESLDCLPTLALEDISKKCQQISLHKEPIGNAELFSHETFTNGISYASVSFPVPEIAPEDIWLLRVFFSLLPQLGCGNRSFEETLEYIEAHTGGIDTFFGLNRQASDPDTIRPTWGLRGKALDTNVDKLFEILSDFLLSSDFNNSKRIFELLERQLNSLENGIISFAPGFAGSLSAASLSAPHAISEQLYGLSYLRNLKALVQDYASQEKPFLEKLSKIKQAVLLTNGMEICFCGDPKTLLHLKENAFCGIANLKTKSFHSWKNPPIPVPVSTNQGIIIPSSVSFTGAALKTVPYTSREAPALRVLSHLVNNLVLHKALREEGGAYGGGASYDSVGGTFSFYSFRDPNIRSTLNTFESCFEKLLRDPISESDLIEAKFNVLQDLDAPISPGSRAGLAHSLWKHGITTAARQNFRDSIFNTTLDDIKAVIAKYFPKGWSKNRCVALAGRELFDKEQCSNMILQSI